MEEQNEVSDLLTNNNIHFRAMTMSSILFRISGFYVYTQADYVLARKLIDDYQAHRRKRFGSDKRPAFKYTKQIVTVLKTVLVVLLIGGVILVGTT